MEAEAHDRTSAAIAPALERKLVTLRQVTQIRRPWKLRFKRRMEVTVSGGWTVIARKRPLKVHDHVVFFENDSFIPKTTVGFSRQMRRDLEDFNGERGYHVKSRMVCKRVSEGHIMAIEELPYVRHIVDIMKEEYGPEEGLRVASMMAFEGVIGVKKWEDSN